MKTPGPIATTLIMSVTGVVAAVVCYFAINAVGVTYPTPESLMNLGATPTPEERATAMADQLIADVGNGTVWLGVCGAILGGLLALTIGLLQGKGARSLIGAIAGCIVAGGLGCLAGSLTVNYHDSLIMTTISGSSDSEMKFMMMHAIPWGLIGLGVGLACGINGAELSLKSFAVSTIVAGIAGCVAGAAFPFAIAIAAPLVESSMPIPRVGTGRMIWVGIASLFIAAGVSRTASAPESTTRVEHAV